VCLDETVLANLRTAGSVIDYMLRSSGQTPLRYADTAAATAGAASAAAGAAAPGVAGPVLDFMLRPSGQRHADTAASDEAATAASVIATGEAATAASVIATGEATDNAAVAIVNGIHADLLSMMRCERHASRD